jgi:thiol-disulfide isomerase/thioredoxin
MKYFIAIFLLLASTLPARAADNAYDILFSGKNMWLNTSRPVTAEDAKGRAVLLDFWTYGCINCMQVVPDLKALEKEFGDKLLVIGVHSAKFVGERDSDRIQAAAKRFGITHPVINDSEFKVWNAMEVKAWPTLVLLDGEGKEVGRYPGEGNREAIAAEIKKLSLGDVKVTGLEMKQEEKGEYSFPARLEVAQTTPWGKMLFVADTAHNRIIGESLEQKKSLIIGSGVEGHADGKFGEASFNRPRGFAITDKGIYVADTGNHMLRYADFEKGTVTTLAGTGERGLYAQLKGNPARDIPLASPWDVALMKDGKTLVIAMAGLHQLWTYDTEKKTVSTLAGTAAEGIKDGPALEASLAQPSGLAVDGDTIYFVDAESSALRMLKEGQVKTLIGTGLFDFGQVDGKYPEAMLQHAQGLHLDGEKIYIADTYNNAIRIYDISNGTLSTLKTDKKLDEPADILKTGGSLQVADSHGITIIDLKIP